MKFTKDLSDLSPVLSVEMQRLRNALMSEWLTSGQRSELLEWAQSLPTLGPYLSVDDTTESNTQSEKPTSGLPEE